MDIIVKSSTALKGEVSVPGDKSISHRAIMLLPLGIGKGKIYNFLQSEDCNRTLFAMRELGAKIKQEGNVLIVEGASKNSLKAPTSHIYVGNSGTTIRLISGILAGIKGSTFLYGDESLNSRPMKRVSDPLSRMGAEFEFLNNNNRAPFIIKGGRLKGIEYQMENASAQVKSGIMLASLFAEGRTVIHEIAKSRDHTERMLKYLGYDVVVKDKIIEMDCGKELECRDIVVPGDMSSAAFIIAAGLLIKDSNIIIRNVLYNYTRAGFIEIAKDMGGNIEILDVRTVNNEEIADIRVKYSKLNSIIIKGEVVPRVIDEIPLIAMLASFADGTTYIKDSEELRHKESNRIKSIVYNLRQYGTEVIEEEDGMVIEGNSFDKKDNIIFNSFKDHRIAMTFSIAGMLFNEARVFDCNNINTSFPGFSSLFTGLGADIKEL